MFKRTTLAIILGALAMATGIAHACTCSPLTVAEARDGADVVFAGDIEDVINVDSPEAREPRVIVTFRVARTWKGPVTASFAMHSNVEFSSCGGFFQQFLAKGATLLVYGNGRPAASWKRHGVDGAPNARSLTVIGDDDDAELPEVAAAVPDDQVVYTTNICTRTAPVQLAVEDFEQLGPAQEFGPLSAMPDPELVERLTPRSNGAPRGCEDLGDARRWKLLNQEPPAGAEIRRVVAADKIYKRIYEPRPVEFREYWFAAQDGPLGYCRVSVDPATDCGNFYMEFRRDPPDSGPWRTWTGGAQLSAWHCDEKSSGK